MPPYRSPSSHKSNNSDVKERVVAGFSYLSLGIIGLIYYLLSGHNNHSMFFRFHFYQSILAGLVIILLGWAISGLTNVIGGLLSLVPGAPLESVSMVAGVLYLIQRLLFIVLLYGAIFAFLGKLCEIPGISKLVRMQLR